MNMMPGVQRVTADTAIGVSGQPVRIYSVNLTSGGSNSSLLLRNGTSASAQENAEVNGTASLCVTANFAGGLLFPLGCFADVDANISYATVVFSTEA